MLIPWTKRVWSGITPKPTFRLIRSLFQPRKISWISSYFSQSKLSTSISSRPKRLPLARFRTKSRRKKGKESKEKTSAKLPPSWTTTTITKNLLSKNKGQSKFPISKMEPLISINSFPKDFLIEKVKMTIFNWISLVFLWMTLNSGDHELQIIRLIISGFRTAVAKSTMTLFSIISTKKKNNLTIHMALLFM